MKDSVGNSVNILLTSSFDGTISGKKFFLCLMPQ